MADLALLSILITMGVNVLITYRKNKDKNG